MKEETVDFKFKAYRKSSEADPKFQNALAAATVELLLVVEIDGVEIPVAQDVLPYATWKHMKHMKELKPTSSSPKSS
jgi:hypothetical protein